MTSTTRTATADRVRAISFAKLEIFDTLTPGARSSSKRVITGPGCTLATVTSTPKSLRTVSTVRDTWSSSSCVMGFSCLFGLSSNSIEGNGGKASASLLWVSPCPACSTGDSACALASVAGVGSLRLRASAACFENRGALLSSITGSGSNGGSSSLSISCSSNADNEGKLSTGSCLASAFCSTKVDSSQSEVSSVSSSSSLSSAACFASQS